MRKKVILVFVAVAFGFLMFVLIGSLVVMIQEAGQVDWRDALSIFLNENSVILLLSELYYLIFGTSLKWLLLIAAIGYAIYRRATAKKRRERQDLARWTANNRAVMKSLGATPEERAAKIDALFDMKADEIRFTLDEPRIHCVISRQLSTMPPKEREALRIAYHLYNLDLIHEVNFFIVRLSLVYAQGKGVIFKGAWQKDPGIYSVTDAIGRRAEDVEPAVNLALRDLTQCIKSHPDHPVLHRLAALLFGTVGEMEPGPPLKTEARVDPIEPRLILGLDAKKPSHWWYFDGEGSLITVAPPGSGKTQGQVFPNLLTWRGPAVVLDVKGEIYDQTSKWRQENVGPVYKFCPLEPAASHCFNPLTTVRSDPEYLWEDARFLADMMIVPKDTGDPFWDRSARDVLTAAIARVCVEEDVAKRPMSNVLDIVHGVGWTKFVNYLQGRVDMLTMRRIGVSLGEMEQKTRDGVLKSAQASLSAWEGERIARATRKSDWSPLDLRGGTSPTIYICLKPNEIDSYTSVLRVLIAQHIRALTSNLPAKEAPPILFLLDELPRLKHMPPIEEALEIGRQYGIRLWMFAQSLGQLEQSYPNADGMIGSCAVRMFMNPSLHDETAQKLSEDIGYRESIIDGTRVKVVEPNVLAGPDFKDFAIVLAASAKPAKLRKYYAYEDPNLTARMGSA
jgi:type IV secretion system protein VirD4